ncbi:hypothetical protein [Serinicoccus kebangsaanensis]|uniref:hypothetical protein n=1 Tax=Serinicoccus kebangsaanensis TaxID=2602069 RepID=UPI00124CADD3|nr:hypothetical protein [Serinicoccus kebangsaanensis]
MSIAKRVLSAAAALAVAGSMMTAAPASAAGQRCDGSQVRTCVSVALPGNDVRARAIIRDVKGDGLDFKVRVTDVQLQRRSGGKWVTLQTDRDYDGWHRSVDKSRTYLLHGCHGNGYVLVRARAHFDWKRVGQAGEWMNSKAVRVYCHVHI